MRKPAPSIKLYPCPRGFECVTLDAYHVRARSQRGVEVSIKILASGVVKFALDHVGANNELFLDPGEAYALAHGLSEASAYAARFHVKPRVTVRAKSVEG